MQKISNPIIIHGPGRSGTTLLSNILSLHNDLYWISGWVDRYPDRPVFGALNKLQYIQWFEKMNRGKRYYPRPAEAYHFWDHYFPGFSNGFVEDVDENSAFACIKTLNRLKRYSGHQRFITKITGQPRTNVLDAIFDKPVILWIDRDPKAVVLSFFKQKWNYKSKPDLFNQKPFTKLIDEYLELYLSFQKGKEQLEAKFNVVVVQYEDMVNDRIAFFTSLCEQLDLSLHPQFQTFIESWSIRNDTNSSYKKWLTPENENYLDQKLSEHGLID